MSDIAIEALKKIKALKSTPIGDTGFAVGPLALFQAAQRIAREALKAERMAERQARELYLNIERLDHGRE